MYSGSLKEAKFTSKQDNNSTNQTEFMRQRVDSWPHFHLPRATGHTCGICRRSDSISDFFLQEHVSVDTKPFIIRPGRRSPTDYGALSRRPGLW